MTCIAYRNGIMACDSCWTFGSTQVASIVKIKRLASGALLGQSGDNDARAVEVLLDKIKDPKKLPTRQQLAETKIDFMGLLAFPRGGVYVISSGPVNEAGWPERDSMDEAIGGDIGVWPATSMGGYAAIGSGGDYALAAMDAGATAKEAVYIACKREINCRPPVHVMKLNPAPVKKKGKKRDGRRPA